MSKFISRIILLSSLIVTQFTTSACLQPNYEIFSYNDKYKQKEKNKITIINPKAKKDILLIHGLGADSKSWKHQIDLLYSMKYRILLVDLSRTYKEDTETSILDKEVADILQYINDNNISKIDIMGISLGSIIAMKIAYQRPDLVNKAVFISPFAQLIQTNKLKLRLLLAKIMPLSITCRFVANGLFDSKEDKKYFLSSCAKYDWRQYLRYLDELKLLDIRNDIKNIKAKSLILIGKQDTTIPMKNQLQVLSLIPKAEKSYVDSNHALIANTPEAVNSILKDWFKSY